MQVLNKARMRADGETPERAHLDTVLHNVRAVVFYSTPHQGANIAHWPGLAMETSPFLNLLKPFDRDLTQHNEAWRQTRQSKSLRNCDIVKQLHEGKACGWQGIVSFMLDLEGIGKG